MSQFFKLLEDNVKDVFRYVIFPVICLFLCIGVVVLVGALIKSLMNVLGVFPASFLLLALLTLGISIVETVTQMNGHKRD